MLLRLLLVLLIVGGASSQSHKIFRSRRLSTEGQVISRVLSDYDANARPPVRDSADHPAILVIANVFINRITWNGNRAEVDLYLRQQWEDSRLQYDVDEREGIDEVSLPLNRKIWSPDTYFSTGTETKSENPLQSVVIEPSGFVRSSEQRQVDIPVNYGTSFPFFNTKSITLRLSSYNYDSEDIVYIWANSPPLVNPVEVSADLLSGPVVFEEASAGDCSGNYSIGVYSCIDVTITFSGSTFGALSAWFFPSLFLVIASWFHFFVHGSWSVPRTFSAALPFFIFSALFIFRYDLISGTPNLVCWFGVCLFFTFFSFLEYFLVICCGIRRSIRYAPSGHPEDHPIGSAKEAMEMAYDTKCASFRNNDGLDVISRALFPVLFVIFLIVYFFVII